MRNFSFFYGSLFLMIIAGWLTRIWYDIGGIAGIKIEIISGTVIFLLWFCVCAIKWKWRGLLVDLFIAFLIFIISTFLTLSCIPE